MFEIRNEPGSVLKNIKEKLYDYIMKNGLTSLVVGLSGGIDSTLSCALAHETVKDISGVRIIGRSLPIESNTPEEIFRGKESGISFCDEFEEKDLTELYQQMYHSFTENTDRDKKTDDTKPEKIRKGNLKARIRMCYLFDLAHYNKGMVLSTDNLTELYLGFWTLHGDVGNYGMVQYLWKTEVYDLAVYLKSVLINRGDSERAEVLEHAIHAVPTDGLGITTSDFDQIGVKSYQEADEILINYLNGNSKHADHPIIKRYISSEFKRHDPQNIKREELFK